MSSQVPTSSSHRPVAAGDALPGPVVALLGFLLVAIVAWVYAPALDGEYVYDDELLFGPANPATDSIGGAVASTFQPLWTFDGPVGESFERAFWRPLAVVAMAVGRAIGGPFGPHLVSLLLHLAAALAAWALATRLLRRTAAGRSLGAPLAGFLVALLFALHPVQAESIAWAAAVNDPLWGALGLLALLFHARWRDAGGERGAPVAAGVLTLLALLSKEQALVLPLLAVGVDLALGARPSKRSLAPYVIALGLWFAARVAIYGDLFGGMLTRQGDFEFPGLAREASFRIELLGGFLGLLAWPADLAVFRPVHPVLPEGSNAVLLGAVWLAATGMALAVAVHRGWRVAAFGLGIAILTPLLVALSVYTAGRYPLSDRYVYVAAFGVALFLVAVLGRIAPRSAATLVVLVLAALGAREARAHLPTFAEPLAFFEAAAEDAPRDPYVRMLAGRAHLDEYRHTLDKVHLEKSYLHFLESLAAGTDYGDKAVEDDPTLPMAERIRRIENMVHLTPAEERKQDPTVFWTAFDRLEANLGQLYCLALAVDVSPMADLELPAEIARQLTELFPMDARTWVAKGQVHERGGAAAEAEAAYRQALERDRRNVTAWRRLASVLSDRGEHNEARRAFEAALDVQPSDPELRADALAAAIAEGQLGVARAHLDALVEIAPGSREAAFWRGRLLRAEGRNSDARLAFDRALEIDPDWGEAHKQMSLVLLAEGEVTQAMEALGRAAVAMPEDFETHYQLAALMLQNPVPGDERYAQRTTDMLAQAYVLAPPDSQRLQIQEVLLPRIAQNPDALAKMGATMRKVGDNFSARVWFESADGASGRWPESTRDANRALLYGQLGQIERASQNYDKAIEYLSRATQLAPNGFEAYFDLATVLRLKNELSRAADAAREALRVFDPQRVAPEAREAVRGTLQSIIDEAEMANQAGPIR